MEYVYAALLLNSAETDVSEDNVKKVIEAAGADADEAKIKALVASLDGVDIKEAIEKQAAAPVQAAPSAASSEGEQKEEKEEEPEEEEEEVSEEEAAEGLGSLFD